MFWIIFLECEFLLLIKSRLIQIFILFLQKPADDITMADFWRYLSFCFWYRRLVKFLLHFSTGQCELQRICYKTRHGALRTGQVGKAVVQYPVGCLSHINSVKWPCSPWVLVTQWMEHLPSVREAMDSIPLRDSRVFSLHHACLWEWWWSLHICILRHSHLRLGGQLLLILFLRPEMCTALF